MSSARRPHRPHPPHPPHPPRPPIPATPPPPKHHGAKLINQRGKKLKLLYSRRYGGNRYGGDIWGPCACYYWNGGWAKWKNYGCMSHGDFGTEAWVWRWDDGLWHWGGAESRRGAYCRCYWYRYVKCWTRP